MAANAWREPSIQFDLFELDKQDCQRRRNWLPVDLPPHIAYPLDVTRARTIVTRKEIKDAFRPTNPTAILTAASTSRSGSSRSVGRQRRWPRYSNGTQCRVLVHRPLTSAPATFTPRQFIRCSRPGYSLAGTNPSLRCPSRVWVWPNRPSRRSPCIDLPRCPGALYPARARPAPPFQPRTIYPVGRPKPTSLVSPILRQAASK